jgi:hypothetical protein
MPRLWDILDNKSKDNMIKAAQRQGMIGYNPNDGSKPHPVSVQGELESEEEISYLATLTPEQFKERFGE